MGGYRGTTTDIESFVNTWWRQNVQHPTVHVAVCVWKTCMYMTLHVFSRSEFGLVHVSLGTGVEHSAFQRFRVTGSLRKENSVHENSI